MVTRIKQIIQHYDLSDRAFAIQCGLKQNTFSNQMNGIRELSLTTINAILSTFPDISAEWLLRGKGEMLIAEEQLSEAGNERLGKLIDTIALLQETVNNYKEKLGDLEARNKRLEAELAMFKNERLIG